MLLGLSAGEFFRLQPRQFHLMLDQWREVRNHQELLTGIVAAELRNRSYYRSEKWAIPRDFMPSYQAGKSERPKRRSRKLIAQDVRNFFESEIAVQEKQGMNA